MFAIVARHTIEKFSPGLLRPKFCFSFIGDRHSVVQESGRYFSTFFRVMAVSSIDTILGVLSVALAGSAALWLFSSPSAIKTLASGALDAHATVLYEIVVAFIKS